MLPFGLCECHYAEMNQAMRAGDKIKAIKTLRNCTSLPLNTAKGIIDMMIEYHESALPMHEQDFTQDTEGQYYEGDKILFMFTEDMIFQDDFTKIHSPNCEDCMQNSWPVKLGKPNCEADISDIYYQIYKNLSDKEKEYVETWIYGNMLHHSGNAIKETLDTCVDIEKHLTALGIDKPKCIKL